MFSNTKLLITTSILIIFLGLTFLLSGFNEQYLQIVSSPTPLLQTPTAVSPFLQEASSSATQGIEGEKVFVTKVVDGDTIEIQTGQSIRLIGIDTPETVDPRRPVGCFGKEASNETKKLLSGKQVILQKDVSETDKYSRLLRYVFLPIENGQTLFVNDYLIRKGFAKVLTYPPDVKFNEQFRLAERQAREKREGLWGSCK